MRGCYVVCHKQLGDLLLLEPAFARLAGNFGGKVHLLTRSGHEALASLMPHVSIARGLPLERRDALYAFDALSKSAWRSFLSRASRKVCLLRDHEGVRSYHAWVYDDVRIPGLGDTYVAEYTWRELDVPALKPFRPPRIDAPPSSWAVSGVPVSYLLANTTSGWKRKCWKIDEWVKTLAALRDRLELPLVVTSGGQPWQIAMASEIAVKTGRGTVNLAGRTDPRQFLWLCGNASLVVTLDGAVSHLSCALERRVVTLFGVTNSTQWHWRTPRTIAIQAPPVKGQKNPLVGLEAETVVATAVQVWEAMDC